MAMSDWLWRMPALHLAEAAHTGGARVCLYELCWGFNSLGASHGLDTLLVFGTTEIETGLTEAGPDAVAQAQRLSGLMRAEHLSFASTGKPGWARYRPDERVTRVYDAECPIARYPEERSRRIWRDQRFSALDLTK
jgi:para-nitrobenzyl esterase